MNTFRRLSIRARISVWIALLSFIGLLLVSGAMFVITALSFEKRSEEALVRKVEQIRYLLNEDRGATALFTLRHKLDDFMVGHDELKLQINTADGENIYTSGNISSATSKPFEQRFSAQTSMLPGKTLQITLAYDSADDRLLLSKVGLTLLAAALTGATLISFGGFFLVQAGLEPLRQLTQQISQVSAKNLNLRLNNVDIPKEIKPLVTQFNDLLARLENAYAQMEGFNADLAHELCTPVATLMTSTETTLKKADLTDGVAELLGSNLEELQRIANIVQDMLFVSQSDRGASARRLLVSSVAIEVQKVIDYHEAAIEEAGLTISVQGDARAQLDVGLIQRALSNLLSNAIRYADRGTAISIVISPEADDKLRIMVSNIGATVDDQHLPRLFDRFYRADGSRIHSDANHGLGLAIVAAVAKMHGGKGLAFSVDRLTRIGFEIDAKEN